MSGQEGWEAFILKLSLSPYDPVETKSNHTHTIQLVYACVYIEVYITYYYVTSLIILKTNMEIEL